MARRDISIKRKGFILVFVSPYCNKKHKGFSLFLSIGEKAISVTIGVKNNHTGSVLIRICSVRGLTVMLTVTAVWATRFKYCQPSFQKLGEGCGSVKSIIVNIVFV